MSADQAQHADSIADEKKFCESQRHALPMPGAMIIALQKDTVLHVWPGSQSLYRYCVNTFGGIMILYYYYLFIYFFRKSHRMVIYISFQLMST